MTAPIGQEIWQSVVGPQRFGWGVDFTDETKNAGGFADTFDEAVAKIADAVRKVRAGE